ncbi:outer membrane beta-barrel protein [Roseateles sp.]|uniref:outer membrane beta-barrel protein n=1 Tax=Roseateles sp. TaxID=1971397 RepID=UPI0025E7FE6F|nr:outer membrane beta-barrel protein [Roseateles sp.]MBV8036536.1 outer membrane beta-barrel protein [Roseateles sp.]
MRNALRPLSGALLIVALSLGAASAKADGAYVTGSITAPDYRNGVNGVGSGSGRAGVSLGAGYDFNSNFGLEGGYFSLGRGRDANGTVNAHGAYLDAIGRLELVPKVSLYGTVGAAQGHFSTTNGNDSSPALKLGGGLQYDLTPTIAVRLGYQQYRFSNAFDSQPRVGEAVLGLKVGF